MAFNVVEKTRKEYKRPIRREGPRMQETPFLRIPEKAGRARVVLLCPFFRGGGLACWQHLRFLRAVLLVEGRNAVALGREPVELPIQQHDARTIEQHYAGHYQDHLDSS